MNSMEDKKMNIGCFDMYYEEFKNVKDGQYVIFAEYQTKEKKENCSSVSFDTPQILHTPV